MKREILLHPDTGSASKNVNYVCFHANKYFVACGTNTGLVHIYGWSNDPSFTQGIEKGKIPLSLVLRRSINPSKDNLDSTKPPPAVTCLQISPGEGGYLAIGLANGTLTIVKAGLRNSETFSSVKPEEGTSVWQRHTVHSPNDITAIIWSDDEGRIFSGCSVGTVVAAMLPPKVSPTPQKGTDLMMGLAAALNIKIGGNLYSVVVAKGKLPIVQMDWKEGVKSSKATDGEVRSVLLIVSARRALLVYFRDKSILSGNQRESQLDVLHGSTVELDIRNVDVDESGSKTGGFGGCLWGPKPPSSGADQTKFAATTAFISQPGGRLWSISLFDGEVQATHRPQFRTEEGRKFEAGNLRGLYAGGPLVNWVPYGSKRKDANSPEAPVCMTTISIFDPCSEAPIESCDEIDGGIIDLCCFSDSTSHKTIYILQSNGKLSRILESTPSEDTFKEIPALPESWVEPGLEMDKADSIRRASMFALKEAESILKEVALFNEGNRDLSGPEHDIARPLNERVDSGHSWNSDEGSMMQEIDDLLSETNEVLATRKDVNTGLGSGSYSDHSIDNVPTEISRKMRKSQYENNRIIEKVSNRYTEARSMTSYGDSNSFKSASVQTRKVASPELVRSAPEQEESGPFKFFQNLAKSMGQALQPTYSSGSSFSTADDETLPILPYLGPDIDPISNHSSVLSLSQDLPESIDEQSSEDDGEYLFANGMHGIRRDNVKTEGRAQPSRLAQIGTLARSFVEDPDPFLPPGQYIVKLDAKNGLGLNLAITGTKVLVLSFTKVAGGKIGPAEQCGKIKIGDTLLGLNGVCLSLLNFDNILTALQGLGKIKEGTVVLRLMLGHEEIPYEGAIGDPGQLYPRRRLQTPPLPQNPMAFKKQFDFLDFKPAYLEPKKRQSLPQLGPLRALSRLKTPKSRCSVLEARWGERRIGAPDLGADWPDEMILERLSVIALDLEDLITMLKNATVSRYFEGKYRTILLVKPYLLEKTEGKSRISSKDLSQILDVEASRKLVRAEIMKLKATPKIEDNSKNANRNNRSEKFYANGVIKRVLALDSNMLASKLDPYWHGELERQESYGNVVDKGQLYDLKEYDSDDSDDLPEVDALLEAVPLECTINSEHGALCDSETAINCLTIASEDIRQMYTGASKEIGKTTHRPMDVPPWPTDEITFSVENAFSLHRPLGPVSDLIPLIEAWLGTFSPYSDPNKDPKRNMYGKNGDLNIDEEHVFLIKATCGLVTEYFQMKCAWNYVRCERSAKESNAIGISTSVPKIRTKLGWCPKNSRNENSQKQWEEPEAMSFLKQYGHYMNMDTVAAVASAREMGSLLRQVLVMVETNPTVKKVESELKQLISAKNESAPEVTSQAVQSLFEPLQDTLLCIRTPVLCIFLRNLLRIFEWNLSVGIKLAFHFYPNIRPWIVWTALRGASMWNDNSPENIRKKRHIDEVFHTFLQTLLEGEISRMDCWKDEHVVQRCFQLAIQLYVSSSTEEEASKYFACIDSLFNLYESLSFDAAIDSLWVLETLLDYRVYVLIPRMSINVLTQFYSQIGFDREKYVTSIKSANVCSAIFALETIDGNLLADSLGAIWLAESFVTDIRMNAISNFASHISVLFENKYVLEDDKGGLIFRSLLSALGPSTTMEFFEKIPERINKIPESFFHGLAERIGVSTEQNHLARTVLSSISKATGASHVTDNSNLPVLPPIIPVLALFATIPQNSSQIETYSSRIEKLQGELSVRVLQEMFIEESSLVKKSMHCTG